MSNYGSVEHIKRKIADGTYKLFTKDGTSSNTLWSYFEGIAVVDDAGERMELPFAIPASSAASERSFSAAGCTVSARRTALSSENVDDILFIHSNALQQ